MKSISVVVPVYKEEANIRPFLARLEPVLEKIGSYEILFCLDPSPDNTEAVIEAEIKRNPNIGLLVFSRRFGQPSAVMAGIHQCSGASCVVIDVDLQDPPELIANLYQKMQEGFDVVYAKRTSRRGETLLKRFISYFGYKLINAVSDVQIPRNTGDFRIMGRLVIDEIKQLKEGHGFLRGLVAFVGFEQAFIEYERDERAHGKGNYNRYWGSLKIGFNGLIGFSNFLLSFVTLLGIAIATSGFLAAIYIAVKKLFFEFPYPMGAPTTQILILIIGGIQLISVGILGEYIGRIYDEVKMRPMYIIKRKITSEETGHEK